MGFDISPTTYYNDKRKVENLKLKRLYHIAEIGFQDQHLERIDNYEMGFKMMWENVLLEKRSIPLQSNDKGHSIVTALPICVL